MTLHELVRRPYRAELWERTGELRARAAVSLHARGELIDLADLVQDPAIRSGFGWDGSIDHHVTGPQPGDEAVVPRAFLERDPGHVLVARDPEGRPCGYSIAYTAGERAGRARRAARSAGSRTRPRDSIVWRDSVDLTRDPRSRVQALLNMAAILRCGLPNPRYAYLPIDARARAGPSAPRSARATSPSSTPAASSATCSTTGPAGCSARCATACCARPGASRSTSARRCAACTCPARSRRTVRARLEDAVERAFGDTADERLLRDVLVRGYFDPARQPRARGAGAASLPRRVLPPPALGLRARGGVYGLVVDSVNVSVLL